MTEKVAVVANQLRDMTLMHPEQDNDHVCSKCGEPVGLYPSSQKALRGNPTAIIICYRCLGELAQPGDEHCSAGTLDDIVREASESVRRQ